MKTFWQLVETIDIPKHNDDISLEQLLRNTSHRSQVQFALEVAEDVFHLNNNDTRAAAQQCIDLVKAWLQDPKQVTTSQLRTTRAAVADAHTDVNAWAAVYAISTAAFAARTTQIAHDIDNIAWNTAWNAAWAYAYAADANNPDLNIHAVKLRQYRNLAIHMQPAKSDKPHYINQNLKDLVQTALRTRDSDMFPIVWDAALDVDLLSDDMQKNYKHYEEHPFTFYHVLNQVIEAK